MADKKASHRRDNTMNITSIMKDPITQLAQAHWVNSKASYDEKVMRSIYDKYIATDSEIGRANHIQLLNFSGYLENYLWSHYVESASLEHTVSILYLVNEKFKENILDVFDSLTTDEKKFQTFFLNVIKISDDNELSYRFYSVMFIKFLINFYKCLENPTARKTGLRYLFLPIWENLTASRLQEELTAYPQLRKMWDNLQSLKASATLTASSNIEATIEDTKKKSAKGKQTQRKKQKVEEPTSSSSSSNSNNTTSGRESTFIPNLLTLFMKEVDSFQNASSVKAEDHRKLLFIQVFLEFICDLLSQLPTRRFLRTLIHDMNVVIQIKLSPLYRISSNHNKLIIQMTDLLDTAMNFPFQDHSGKALALDEVLNIHYKRMHSLQQIIYTDHFTTMKDMIFSSIGRLLKEENLRKNLLGLNLSQLCDIAVKLGRISKEFISKWTASRSKDASSMDEANDQEDDGLYEYVMQTLIDYLVPKPSQLEEINMLSLYPTEDILWNDSIMPPSNISHSEQVLALPKLNIQFLTLYDYLLRNFHLYRLETAYEIREDLVDTIKRMGPKISGNSSIAFRGWARMALPTISVAIDEVAPPKLSSPCPAFVHASIMIDLSRFTGVLRQEWESLREHDVIFLVSIEKPMAEAEDQNIPFQTQFGVKYIRGGEVFEYYDEDNIPLNDIARPDSRSSRFGSKRKLRVKLDPAQYYTDLKEGKNCYDSFNLLIRRDPKESNFRSVLETIRDIMNTDIKGQSIPPWLNDVFLGYGSPTSANYRNLSVKDHYDFLDTFLDAAHIIESFPNAAAINFIMGDKTISIDPKENFTDSMLSSLPSPPYKLSLNYNKTNSNDSTLNDWMSNQAGMTIDVIPYTIPLSGPYPEDLPLKNQIRFTPAQIEAIHSGVNPGLTMIVGPPGTGKTDTAVQIISNLYHNYPTQKIVLVTHSNAALNDLFMKIMERNVDPRHLLRLGSGERDLRDSLADSGTSKIGLGKGEQFDKQGRVNYCLERRLFLLNKVKQLSESIHIVGDYDSSCENALYLYKDQIKKIIEKFENDMTLSQSENTNNIMDIFPFKDYFADVPEALFTGDIEKDIDSARGCIRHVQKIFEELSDYRAFELLRNHTHRSDYLLLKQARIVAMTCTHAAISRSRLLELDFKYDSLVMEEAAQILDVETVIPMLLQHHDAVNGCRLKRVILIGDHYQLPPIIQNLTLQKYARYDQSLFTRWIRLGVPRIILDQQGRARPEICSLYNWRYKQTNGLSLKDLSSIFMNDIRYQQANTGFKHTYQLIHVDDFKGKGEFAPTPYFYQNLGEAEYVVATYQYMRLMGYPSDQITILTTYNGQKHLISDILRQRCSNQTIFGFPKAVSTVDKYQGQQNDYILLSLVRTQSIGHIRDIRRLVVALSRSKLGLYIFCNKQLYSSCFELQTVFALLSDRSDKLQLITGENFPTNRLVADKVSDEKIYTVNDVTMMGVLVYQLTQHAVTKTYGERASSEKVMSLEENAMTSDERKEETIESKKIVADDVEEVRADPQEQID